jgi:hypothetical protein
MVGQPPGGVGGKTEGFHGDSLLRRRLPITSLAGTLRDMSTVAEIKAAISRLSLEERAEVARCLHEWEDDAWDGQMQHDLAAGKLDGLLAKVDADIDAGKLRDLP